MDIYVYATCRSIRPSNSHKNEPKFYQNFILSFSIAFYHASHLFIRKRRMTGSSSNKELTDDSRMALYIELLIWLTNMVLLRGAIKYTANMFSTSVIIVQRILMCKRVGVTVKETLYAVRSKRKGRCGLHKVNESIINEALWKYPLRLRRTMRHADHALRVAPSILKLFLNQGVIRRYSATLKSLLTKKQNFSALLSIILNWREHPSVSRNVWMRP